MLRKSHIFYFFSILIIAFVAGFFVWNIFANPDSDILNQVLAEANNIGFKFFPASLSADLGADNIISRDVSDQDVALIEDVVPDTNLGNDQSVITQENFQDQLDDIQEKLDIISQQIQALIAQQNTSIQPAVAQISQQSDDENNQNQDNNQNNNQDNNNNSGVSGGGGGGPASVVYPEILISEVQVYPIEQRFVELYNPNSQDVDLTGWYLQRKDSNDASWNSFVSSTNFQNKTIPAGGYFLISRQLPNSNVLYDITLSNDNSLALKNPDGDISDKLGFGNAVDPELLAAQNPATGQSVGRKVLVDNTEQETDNNLNDFEIQTPTPKVQNITYVAPAPTPTPTPTPKPTPVPLVLKNILISEIQVSGKTADDEFVELYNPNNDSVDLSGFVLKNKNSNGTEGYLVSSLSKSMPALGYFLIAPQTGYLGAATPDLYYSGASYSVTANNTILLYDNNGNLSDKVGIGTSSDFETADAKEPSTGQSIGRKVLEDGTEQNTGDNSADFEIQTPTTRAQNVTYIPPVPSSDDTVTSSVYTINPLASGAGTITNIPFATAKNAFLSNLILATNSTLDSSGITDPVSTGNTLAVTAQDGITKATYTITTNPVSVTQVKIISAPQTISAGVASGVFTIESQNASGAPTKVLTETHINLSSDSATGLFSSSPYGGPCNNDWGITSIYISSGTAHKSFCYKDSVAGTPTITVSSAGLSSDSQTITVN